MKLEIYQETPPTPPEDEPIRLRLRRIADGVLLEAVDSIGVTKRGGHLLTISQNHVYFHGSINEKLGFKMTLKRRLISSGT